MPHRRSVILVLASTARRQQVLEHRCTELGYTVAPVHAYDLGAEVLLRVKPRVALVDLAHPAAESRMFLAQAMALGTRVVLLGDGVEGPRQGGIFAFGGGVPPVMTDPVEDGLAQVLQRAIAVA